MPAERVVLRDFKVFEQLDVSLHPQLNLLVGDNGAGKSSFLEALKLVGRAKLTGLQARELSRFGSSAWQLAVGWQDFDVRTGAKGSPHQARISWKRGLELRLDQKPISAGELAREFPTAGIDVSVQRLIAEGPALRRQFIDWSLFHVEQSYAVTWAAWRRCLAQRNRCLVEQRPVNQLRAFNDNLARHASQLTDLRRRHVAGLAAAFSDLADALLGIEAHYDLGYEPGWSADRTYAEVLLSQESRDQSRRSTIDGPQRADLVFRSSGGAARTLSRGQQKLMFAALVFAGCRQIAAQRNRWPLLLVDDFAAELAKPAQQRLAAAIAGYAGQAIVTMHESDPKLWPTSARWMFHVEHGKIARGVE